jgi:hypothetical protein
MAGFTPDEGERLVENLVLNQSDVDRGTDLELMLFTNASPGETITEATLTEPTGTGYARINLTDASWSVGAYALQTFVCGSGGWTGSVYGYAVVTKGATPRIVTIEVDAAGPFTFIEFDRYDITPTISVA